MMPFITTLVFIILFHNWAGGTSARKMRAIAYIRLGLIDDAFADIQLLLAENMDDPSKVTKYEI